MFTLIMLGPPGAGKGTQSALIAEKYNLMHISTGNLLRHEIAIGSEIGLNAKTYIDKGCLVPDEVLVRMLNILLQSNKGINGYIFDGFPRTIVQAEAFDRMLELENYTVNLVLSLLVSEPELIIRLKKRAVDENRSDDKPDVIHQRLLAYNEQTKPLIDYYSEKNILTPVYGIGNINEIFNLLCLEIENYINLS